MSTSELSKMQRRLIKLAVGTATMGALVLGLLAPGASAAAAPVPTPVVPGVPTFLWPSTALPKVSSDAGLLSVDPPTGPVGAQMTISGKGLAPGKTVTIIWSTSNVQWTLDARPDSVDYLGRSSTNVGAIVANATTDASGAFTKAIRVPNDYGAVHDILATIDGKVVAKGGFLVARSFTISPTSGPIGTKVHVHITGMAASLYGSSESLWWDSKYVGVATGVWGRGSADYEFRASGPVGRHWIQLAGGMQFNYLNFQQSPVPWAIGTHQAFEVTADNGPPPAEIEWPAQVTPTIDTRTTLAAANLAPESKATISLDSSSGPIQTKVAVSAAGLTPGGNVDLAWSTVVGNRVNCTGTCWQFVTESLATGKAGADGTYKAEITVPDGLGGYHVVQVAQAGKVVAQTPYYVKRSIMSYQRFVKEGETFTIHLKGIGWTQLDNTIAVDYDNGYIGYACGFNSNGDVVIPIVATGGKGTHLIDLYPLLYTYQPAYAYPPHGMVPFLSWKTDFPGLAAGYNLPVIRLAVTIR